MANLLPIKAVGVLLVSASLSFSAAEGEPPPHGVLVANGPVYPQEMIKRNIEGEVIMKADISTQGITTNCHIISTTNDAFNSSALDYCHRVRYSPATNNGVPVIEYGKRMIARYRLDG